MRAHYQGQAQQAGLVPLAGKGDMRRQDPSSVEIEAACEAAKASRFVVFGH